MDSKHNGFTIVELLVVIVVIAILASITLVTYTGIKDRAYNAQTISTASNVLKIIDIAHASQGTITLNNGIPNGGIGFCIGDPADFPADSHFGSGECNNNGGWKGHWASQEMWNVLKQYGNGDLSLRAWNDGDGSYIRGITYTYQKSKTDNQYYEYLMYNLVGKNKDCTLAGAATVSDIDEFTDGSNETSCWINMTKRYNGADIFNW